LVKTKTIATKRDLYLAKDLGQNLWREHKPEGTMGEKQDDGNPLVLSKDEV